MGIARMHGGREDTHAGNTPHQKLAHKLLVDNDFEWERKTGHEGNVYRHAITNTRIIVHSTPRSSSQDLKKIARQIRNVTGGDPMATSEKSKTAPLIAMADPFLLKEPKNQIELRARRSALVGYIKRVLEKHGPMESATLMTALEELGFQKSASFKARAEAGGIGFIGENGAKLVALEHQIPEGATLLGRPRETPELGVTTGAEEPAEHPVGENNGAGPEPREEPAEAAEEVITKPLDSWPAGQLAPGVDPAPQALVDDPSVRNFERLVDPSAIPFQNASSDGDVLAAAQLLIQSLGIKTVAPEALEFIGSAERAIEDARNQLMRAENLLTRIRECLA